MTSSASTASCRSVLSIVRETLAKPVGFRLCVPRKITSSIFSPRRLRVDCSPSTQRTASPTLLFPLPFGPTTPVIPSWNCRMVLLANDLNPCISMDLRYIIHLRFFSGKNCIVCRCLFCRFFRSALSGTERFLSDADLCPEALVVIRSLFF